MKAPLIQTKALNFSFKGNGQTLHNVELNVPEGSIYGFLGPNGAGKTTTLRLLLGLLRCQEGSIEVFGMDVQKNRLDILLRTGSLIESPSLYGHLTARENLEVYRNVYQCEKSRLEEVLKIVGLNDSGDKKAKQFSLGMKQRLSIAVALLHEPDLLILDEPTNGLDPNGIIEIRELIRKLNRERGTTVLVSSHLLAEVERMATHVGIIHKGKLLFQGELGALQQMKLRQSALEIETSDNNFAEQLLKSFPVQIRNGKITLPFERKEQSAVINRMLVENGVDVYSLQPQQSDLEELFIDITNNRI